MQGSPPALPGPNIRSQVQRRPSALGLILALAAVLTLTVACGSGGSNSTAEPPTEEPPDSSQAPPQAQHLTSVGPADRFVVPKFAIDAPLTYRRVEAEGPRTGEMPNPDGPDDVAYYDFSGFEGLGGGPGLGGNAVFAGHVDSGHKACKNGRVPPPCTAVLWDISELKPGDVIEIHVSGTVHKYAVKSNTPVSARSDFSPIVASTATESITVITCGGDFNRATGEYDDRQVVTAERVT
jgi:LPXTG-site transpeptidase (sortase) family protein